MKVIRAAHFGMCFGVRDAIRLALDHRARGPITVLGDLVHNPSVLQELATAGVVIADRPDETLSGDVMITAHGASERAIDSLRDRGLNVVEATCPLVHAAHRAVKQLVAAGFHPVIVGRRDHVEVRGLTEDLDAFDVILTEEDIAHLAERPRFGVAAQTTQPIDHVRHLVKLLGLRFPQSEIRFVDTVCQPTKQRQAAAVELAQSVDVVIVVGGAHSNNTRELTRTCRRFCAQVYQVGDSSELSSDWFERARSVGITAGTSTPDAMVDAVEARVRELAMERSSASHA
jgi:4-hydroxy-3-methylbut-2-enyl diphosphate reductase